MPKFAVSITLKLQIEADNVLEAAKKFHIWREFIMAALRGRLTEAGITRIRIPPAKEYLEFDDAWLENDRLRSRFQQEWEYTTEEVPVIPGSKVTLIHKIAVGPKREDVAAE